VSLSIMDNGKWMVIKNTWKIIDRGYEMFGPPPCFYTD